MSKRTRQQIPRNIPHMIDALSVITSDTPYQQKQIRPAQEEVTLASGYEMLDTPISDTAHPAIIKGDPMITSQTPMLNMSPLRGLVKVVQHKP